MFSAHNFFPQKIFFQQNHILQNFLHYHTFSGTLKNNHLQNVVNKTILQKLFRRQLKNSKETTCDSVLYTRWKIGLQKGYLRCAK